MGVDEELGLAEALAAQGRPAEAIELARQILRRNLGHPGALALIDRLEELAGPIVAGEDWRPGVVVEGRWEVFGSAQGGMGRVHFVRDREWGGVALAVKSLLDHAGEDADLARRFFRRETQVWLDLGAHPHIVSGFYTLAVGGAQRFFMEYVPGASLAAELGRGPLAPPRILDLAIQLADGMTYVHGRGVVHRDLKPANCLVMEDDTLRVTDFGLGKSSGEGDVPARRVTAGAGELSVHGAGTPFYMAPEQWRSLAAAGSPADVYAFGVLLWEMIVGRRPFESSASCWSSYAQLPIVLERLVSSGNPRPDLVLPLMHEHLPALAPSAVGVGVPLALDELILACLAKPPEARPPFAEVAARLRLLYRTITGVEHPRPAAAAIAASDAGEANRALSYEVMEDHATATRILDEALARRPTALYPWLNRASLAIESGVQPCLVAARARAELLPAHPVAEDPRVAAYLERLAAFHRAVPEPMSLDVSGSVLAVGGRDRLVRVLDGDTGAELAALGPHADVVLAVCFAGDALAVADGREVALWRRGERQPTRIGGHQDLVTSLATSPSGDLLASGANDATVVLRHATGTRTVSLPALPRTLVWQAGTVFALDTEGAIHALGGTRSRVVPAGATALAAGEQGIFVGDEAGSITLHTTAGAAGAIRAHRTAIVALAAAGPELASAGADGVVSLWRGGQRIGDTPPLRGRIRALRYLPGPRLAIASDAGELHVWSLAPTGKWPRLLARDLSAVEKRRRADEASRVVARLDAGEPTALAEARALRDRHPEQRRDERFAGALHRAILRRGLLTGVDEVVGGWTTHLDGPALGAAALADGSVIAVTTPRALVLLDGASGGVLASTPVTGDLGVALEPAGAMVATARGPLLVDPRSGARLWGAAWDGGELHAAIMRAGVIAAGGWSRSMMRTAFQAQGTLRVWIPAQGVERSFTKVGQTIGAVCVAADGTFVGGTLDDGQLLIWSIEGKVAYRASSTGIGSAMALADDLRRVAVGQQDGTIAIYATSDPRPLATVRAHGGAVRTLGFTAGDRWLASVGADGAIKLWDVPTLAPLASVSAHAHPARLVISPAGSTLVTAGEDHLVRSWRVGPTWREARDATTTVGEHLARGGQPRLDALLDAWRETARLAPELGEPILAELRTLVRRESPTGAAERLSSPYLRALRVDASLASRL